MAAVTHPVRNAVNWLAQSLAVVSALGILLLVAVTITDITLRAISGSGIRGTAEIIELAMPIVAYFAFSYAQQRRAHVATTLVTDRLAPRIAARVELVGLSVLVAFIGWMTVATAQAAVHAFQAGQVRFGLLSLPTWPSKAAIALGLLALLLIILVQVIDTMRRSDASTSDGSTHDDA